jgi:hypothetical protein
VILGKEMLQALDIFGSFPSGGGITHPTDLEVEGAGRGVPRVDGFLNVLFLLIFDDKGERS